MSPLFLSRVRARLPHSNSGSRKIHNCCCRWRYATGSIFHVSFGSETINSRRFMSVFIAHVDARCCNAWQLNSTLLFFMRVAASFLYAYTYTRDLGMSTRKLMRVSLTVHYATRYNKASHSMRDQDIQN